MMAQAVEPDTAAEHLFTEQASKHSFLPAYDVVECRRTEVRTRLTEEAPVVELILWYAFVPCSPDCLGYRSLVYGSLTVSLVLAYISSVVLLQGALRALTGQESQLAVVVSTLAIAALFNPLR